MLEQVKKALRAAGVDTRAVYQTLSSASIDAACRQQNLAPLVTRLREVVPDVRDQYTDGPEKAEFDRYWEPKMRGLHAFQMRAVMDALEQIGGNQHVVVDIGDSSGTHPAYLRSLLPGERIARVVSVNLDAVAVEKVRAKGGEAVLSRAEELDLGPDLQPSLYMSFETLEHMTDPLRFLHGLAIKGAGEHIVFSVPYQRQSRFGGHHLRLSPAPERLTPENLHILELSPDDWGRVSFLAGFRPVWTRIYRQYPTWPNPLAATRPLWKRLDFEGFITILARRDLSLANRYTGW